MLGFSTILVLSPHPDDAELGAGGTIARFVEEGKQIFYVTFSSCEKSIPQGLPSDVLRVECRNSTGELGIPLQNLTMLNFEVRDFPRYRQEILENLVELGEKIKPDLTLVPSSSDTHQDHQVIHHEALRAFKKMSSIWGYEHPWNNLSFTTDVFVSLEERHIEKKMNALAQYKSQDFRSYMQEKYIKALAYTRAAQVDFPYAEAFELLRLLAK